MRMILSTLTTILLLTQTGFAIEEQEYPVDKLKEQNREIIKMVVKEISKDLPQQVDKYTTMSRIRDENLTLIYTFEINTGAKSDKAVIKDDKSRMQKAISRGICQSSKRFLEAGVTLSYEYLSKSTKKELFTFTMNQKKCKELKYD
jgi:hypothetical protein